MRLDPQGRVCRAAPRSRRDGAERHRRGGDPSALPRGRDVERRRRPRQPELLDQGLDASFRPFPADAGKLAAGHTRSSATCGRTPGVEGTRTRWRMRAGHARIGIRVGRTGTGVCFFGELIALGMKERGCVGALIDGGIRDIGPIGEPASRYTPVIALPYSRSVAGRCATTGYRFSSRERAEAVAVHPGDFILADEDGAIVIRPRSPSCARPRGSTKGARSRDSARDRGRPLASPRAHEVRARVSGGWSLSTRTVNEATSVLQD